MRRYFVQLFWGLSFAFFVYDFLFDNFLLLLFQSNVRFAAQFAFIIGLVGVSGYLLVISGCDALFHISPRISRSGSWCKYLALLFVVMLLTLQLDNFLKWKGLSTVNNRSIRDAAFIFFAIFSLFLRYKAIGHLLAGFTEHFENIGTGTMVRRGWICKIGYTLLLVFTFFKSIVVALTIFSPQIHRSLVGTLAVIHCLLSLLVIYVVLEFVYQARNEWPTDAMLCVKLPVTDSEKADSL